MYKLALTASERQAIDWVGYRYSHGDDLYKLLCKCDWFPNDRDWDSPKEIEFAVSENIAWQIADIGEESNWFWDCFAEELARKLTDFCMSVV